MDAFFLQIVLEYETFLETIILRSSAVNRPSGWMGKGGPGYILRNGNEVTKEMHNGGCQCYPNEKYPKISKSHVSRDLGKKH